MMDKTQGKRFYELEMLRGAAALYVALTHSVIWHFIPKYSVLGMLLSFGEEAVIIFFLLSGFVIYYSVVSDPEITFKKYFMKRLIRIYPLFIVAFLLSYSTIMLEGKFFPSINFPDLFGNLFMLQSNNGMNPGCKFNVYFDNAPLWSLSFEWYFYMMFYPINKYISSKYIKILILGISFVGYFTFFIHPNQFSAILLYLLIWWTGVEIAKSYLNFNRIHFKDISFDLFSLILLSLLVAIPALKDYNNHTWTYPLIQMRHFISTLLILLIGYSWARFNFFGYNKLFGIFKVFAPISYGIYIFHWPILNDHNFLKGITFEPLRLIFMMLTVILFAYIFEMRFQKMVMRLYKKSSPLIRSELHAYS